MIEREEPEPEQDEILETGLDSEELPIERVFHHPGLTERVASFGRSTLVTALLCVLFGAFIAAAIVIGFRWPAAWSLVLLTKITPGIGLLWFAVRREWRSLAIALGAVIMIVVDLDRHLGADARQRLRIVLEQRVSVGQSLGAQQRLLNTVR